MLLFIVSLFHHCLATEWPGPNCTCTQSERGINCDGPYGIFEGGLTIEARNSAYLCDVSVVKGDLKVDLYYSRLAIKEKLVVEGNYYAIMGDLGNNYNFVEVMGNLIVESPTIYAAEIIVHGAVSMTGNSKIMAENMTVYKDLSTVDPTITRPSMQLARKTIVHGSWLRNVVDSYAKFGCFGADEILVGGNYTFHSSTFISGCSIVVNGTTKALNPNATVKVSLLSLPNLTWPYHEIGGPILVTPWDATETKHAYEGSYQICSLGNMEIAVTPLCDPLRSSVSVDKECKTVVLSADPRNTESQKCCYELWREPRNSWEFCRCLTNLGITNASCAPHPYPTPDWDPFSPNADRFDVERMVEFAGLWIAVMFSLTAILVFILSRRSYMASPSKSEYDTIQ